jgi:hypothetical protein
MNRQFSFRFHWVAKIWLLGTLLWLSACERDAGVEVPATAPKLVLSCFLSPQDTVLKVNVSKSVPIYNNPADGNQGPWVDDATVTLSDGASTVRLTLIKANTGEYTTRATNLPILSGKTYYLNVSAPGGFQAEAFCTIPAQAHDAVSSIRLDSTLVEGGIGKEYSLSVEWQDAPGEGDYYRLFAERPSSIQWGYNPNDLEKPDTLYYSINFEQGDEYTRDLGQEGRKFLVKNGKFVSLFDPSGMGNTDGLERKINVVLLTTDRGYFEYHRALKNYVGDNPFSEPILLFSNVKGGLGIMSGYQRVTRIYRY